MEDLKRILKECSTDLEAFSEFYREQRKALSSVFEFLDIETQVAREFFDGFSETLVSPISDIAREKTAHADLIESNALIFAVRFVKGYVSTLEDRVVPNVLSIVVRLHSLLFDLVKLNYKPLKGLEYEIAKLLELWYDKELPEYEAIVPNMISYLLLKTLEPGATNLDIKRFYKVKSALSLIDFSDDNTEWLSENLLRIYISPLYLSSKEGLRLMSYLFGIYAPLIEDIHATIKNQIPFAPNKTLVKYGQVYFRAWHTATGENLSKIESACISDLITHAIFASTPKMFRRLFLILNVFHKNKKMPGVDELILRYWEPVIWRELKSANQAVRKNAVILFGDFFPIQNKANKEANELLLKRQLTALTELLVDGGVPVRAATVQVVGKILNYFWDTIPSKQIIKFLNIIMSKLIFDSSSILVRVSSVKALREIISNPVSHPTMKTLLGKGQFGMIIHDKSERVRLEFVNLIVDVNSYRFLKVEDIVSIEHILYRLSLDNDCHYISELIDYEEKTRGNPRIRRSIGINLSRILADYLFPVNNNNPKVWVYRTIEAIKANPYSILAFYFYLREIVDIEISGKILHFLIRFYHEKISKKISKKSRRKKDKEVFSDIVINEDGFPEKYNSNSVLDFVLMTIYILWSEILNSKDTSPDIDGDTSLKARIEESIVRKLHEIDFARILEKNFSSVTHNAVMGITGTLVGYTQIDPISSIEEIIENRGRRTKGNFRPDDPAYYGPIIRFVLQTEREDEFIDILTRTLVEGVESPGRHSSKRIEMALRMIDYALMKYETRFEFLNGINMNELVKALVRYVVVATNKLTTSDKTFSQIDDKVVVSAVKMVGKVYGHIFGSEDFDDSEETHPQVWKYIKWGVEVCILQDVDNVELAKTFFAFTFDYISTGILKPDKFGELEAFLGSMISEPRVMESYYPFIVKMALGLGTAHIHYKTKVLEEENEYTNSLGAILESTIPYKSSAGIRLLKAFVSEFVGLFSKKNRILEFLRFFFGIFKSSLTDISRKVIYDPGQIRVIEEDISAVEKGDSLGEDEVDPLAIVSYLIAAKILHRKDDRNIVFGYGLVQLIEESTGTCYEIWTALQFVSLFFIVSRKQVAKLKKRTESKSGGETQPVFSIPQILWETLQRFREREFPEGENLTNQDIRSLVEHLEREYR